MSVTKVTKENFREVLPKLKEELKICEFVAIDAEFSGLVCPERQQFRCESFYYYVEIGH